MSNVSLNKEKIIDHWECKVCKALSPHSAHTCWRCELPQGSERTTENIALAKNQIPRARVGGCGTIILVMFGIVAALFTTGILILLNAMSYAK